MYKTLRKIIHTCWSWIL